MNTEQPSYAPNALREAYMIAGFVGLFYVAAGIGWLWGYL